MATRRSSDSGDSSKQIKPPVLHEVDGLRELRQLAGKGQAEIASALNIKQPSVSKIENQNDMYLSTLRSYVDAIGGELELKVKLPEGAEIRLHHLGTVSFAVPEKVSSRRKGTESSSRWRHG